MTRRDVEVSIYIFIRVYTLSLSDQYQCIAPDGCVSQYGFLSKMVGGLRQRRTQQEGVQYISSSRSGSLDFRRKGFVCKVRRRMDGWVKEKGNDL